MKHLAAFSELLLLFFGVTLLFTILNHSAVLPWATMEILWLLYLPLLSFFYAYIFGCHYHFRGGGVFLAFCLIAPPVVFSYYANLPWGYFFFAPLPLLLAAAASILGEAFGNLRQNAQEEKNVNENKE